MGVPIAVLTTNMCKSDLICDICGAEFFVYRPKCRLREEGHTKHVWCHVCKEVTPHRERKTS